MKTIADKIIAYNSKLKYIGVLPNDFDVINPFLENPETLIVMRKFYKQFYDDNLKRKFIIGINPSRHGAGVTGVPFTDTKRLESACGIEMQSARTHEVSSVFMYDMIAQYGGVKSFYQNFYINSPFPLAIIRRSGLNQWVNANYYDDIALYNAVRPFMIQTLQSHISLGLDTAEVYVLGKKNATFIKKINQECGFFKHIVALEHPRFIQQYKSKEKQVYVDKYLNAFEA